MLAWSHDYEGYGELTPVFWYTQVMKKYKTLDDFFDDQDANKLKKIMLIREIIFDAEPAVVESIKWNAPNYSYNGEDRITFNVMNKQNKVKILLHMGAKKRENRAGKPVIKNVDALVQWNSDIRGTVDFDDVSDIESKRSELKKLFTEWLKIS